MLVMSRGFVESAKSSIAKSEVLHLSDSMDAFSAMLEKAIGMGT